MTVDLLRRKTKNAELVRQRLKICDLFGGPKSLKTIDIHQYRQILQTLMASEDQGLPARAFVPFSIRSEAEDMPRFALHALGQCQASGKRETVPKAAGREKNFRDASCRRMSAQSRVVLVEVGQLAIGQ